MRPSSRRRTRCSDMCVPISGSLGRLHKRTISIQENTFYSKKEMIISVENTSSYKPQSQGQLTKVS
jgi:hypothetical protein